MGLIPKSSPWIFFSFANALILLSANILDDDIAISRPDCVTLFFP